MSDQTINSLQTLNTSPGNAATPSFSTAPPGRGPGVPHSIGQRVRLSQSGRKKKPVVTLPKLNLTD